MQAEERRKHEQIVGFGRGSQKSCARRGVAHRDQHLAEFEVTRAANQEGDDQREATQQEHAARVPSACTLKPRISLKSVRAIIAAEAKIVRKKPSSSGKSHRLRADREIGRR